VTCKGRGCPIKSATRVAKLAKPAKSAKPVKSNVVAVEFPGFERSLRAGITLEIRVSKAGEVGKYTRFVVRRGKLPLRVDTCLAPAGVKPMACPSS
jgi:hypothetical protein